jgi:Ser/Thr protein kinase RdoA (MazF antagonist)
VPASPADDLVAAGLARFPALAGLAHRVLSGGLRSVNVLVGEDRVLRAGLAAPDLAREAAILRRVAPLVRVPRVLAEADGALLLEYVPHEELPDVAPAGAAAGRAAARIHSVAFDRSGFLDASLRVAEPFPSALDGLRAYADGLLAGPAGRALGTRATAIRRAWDRHDARLRAATSRAVLTHGDFKPANVKWLPAPRDVVVFDWEFAWSGPALMDVGQTFRWGTGTAFRDAFVAAYRAEGGDFPDDWEAIAPLLDLFHLTGLLDHAAPAPVRDRDVLARVDRTLARA